jgi:hypothetical protein
VVHWIHALAVVHKVLEVLGHQVWLVRGQMRKNRRRRESRSSGGVIIHHHAFGFVTSGVSSRAMPPHFDTQELNKKGNVDTTQQRVEQKGSVDTTQQRVEQKGNVDTTQQRVEQKRQCGHNTTKS